mgnify:CR=1 FL=1
MELYRAVVTTAISLDSTSPRERRQHATSCDSALRRLVPELDQLEVTASCTGSPLPNECNPSRSVTGADRKPYRVDTYITLRDAGPARVRSRWSPSVVRNAGALSARPLARAHVDVRPVDGNVSSASGYLAERNRNT